MSVDPQVILLTGCASGIGQHLAGAFAQRGWLVMATDVAMGRLEEACRTGGWPSDRVVTRALDVRDRAAWAEVLAATEDLLGPPDVLLHVAGYLSPGYIAECDPMDIDRHLSINAAGVMQGTRVVLPGMIERERGHIVVVGSLAGIAPVPGIALYSASKFAVRGFTLALAEEVRPRGVAVSLISPDAVETPMLDLQVHREEAAMTFSGARPLRVEDIERAVFDTVLPHRPVELTLPGHRGWLARVGGAVPGLSRGIGPLVRAVGRHRQRRYRRGGR